MATYTACKLTQLTFLCMPLPAPVERAPSLAAAGSPAPQEAALTGPSLHTFSSIHESVVAPNTIRSFPIFTRASAPSWGRALAPAGIQIYAGRHWGVKHTTCQID